MGVLWPWRLEHLVCLDTLGWVTLKTFRVDVYFLIRAQYLHSLLLNWLLWLCGQSPLGMLPSGGEVKLKDVVINQHILRKFPVSTYETDCVYVPVPPLEIKYKL